MIKQKAPQKPAPKRKKKRRPSLDYTTLKSFTTPVVLYTYGGPQLVDRIRFIWDYMVKVDLKSPETIDVNIPKNTLLFAVQLAGWNDVKPQIKRRSKVADLKLGPADGLYKRHVVRKPPMHTDVKIVIRNGLVMAGQIVNADTFHMISRVAGKVVLIWKHAVHDIEVV